MQNSLELLNDNTQITPSLYQSNTNYLTSSLNQLYLRSYNLTKFRNLEELSTNENTPQNTQQSQQTNGDKETRNPVNRSDVFSQSLSSSRQTRHSSDNNISSTPSSVKTNSNTKKALKKPAKKRSNVASSSHTKKLIRSTYSSSGELHTWNRLLDASQRHSRLLTSRLIVLLHEDLAQLSTVVNEIYECTRDSSPNVVVPLFTKPMLDETYQLTVNINNRQSQATSELDHELRSVFTSTSLNNLLSFAKNDHTGNVRLQVPFHRINSFSKTVKRTSRESMTSETIFTGDFSQKYRIGTFHRSLLEFSDCGSASHDALASYKSSIRLRLAELLVKKLNAILKHTELHSISQMKLVQRQSKGGRPRRTEPPKTPVFADVRSHSVEIKQAAQTLSCIVHTLSSGAHPEQFLYSLAKKCTVAQARKVLAELHFCRPKSHGDSVSSLLQSLNGSSSVNYVNCDNVLSDNEQRVDNFNNTLLNEIEFILTNRHESTNDLMTSLMSQHHTIIRQNDAIHQINKSLRNCNTHKLDDSSRIVDQRHGDDVTDVSIIHSKSNCYYSHNTDILALLSQTNYLTSSIQCVTGTKPCKVHHSATNDSNNYHSYIDRRKSGKFVALNSVSSQMDLMNRSISTVSALLLQDTSALSAAYSRLNILADVLPILSEKNRALKNPKCIQRLSQVPSHHASLTCFNDQIF